MRSVTYFDEHVARRLHRRAGGRFDWTAPEPEVFRFWIERFERSRPSVWDDGCTRRCCTGRPLTRIHWTTQSSSGRHSGSRSRRWSSRRRCRRCRAMPPGLGRRGGGDQAVTSGAGGGRHRDRRRDARREAAALGLIDEYRAMVYPVLVGGGIAYFPRREPGWISNSSRPGPSARASSISATAWRASRSSGRAGPMNLVEVEDRVAFVERQDVRAALADDSSTLCAVTPHSLSILPRSWRKVVLPHIGQAGLRGSAPGWSVMAAPHGRSAGWSRTGRPSRVAVGRRRHLSKSDLSFETRPQRVRRLGRHPRSS